jgi:hypothetical protein
VYVFVCVRVCLVCVVVLYCYVVGSYPIFLLNRMKRNSPVFLRKKKILNIYSKIKLTTKIEKSK